MKPFLRFLVVLAPLCAASGAFAQADPYRYSGQHAGGPASDLAPVGKALPSQPRRIAPAYRYSGTRAGGPAGDLAPRATPSVSRSRPAADPAYRLTQNGVSPPEKVYCSPRGRNDSILPWPGTDATLKCDMFRLWVQDCSQSTRYDPTGALHAAYCFSYPGRAG